MRLSTPALPTNRPDPTSVKNGPSGPPSAPSRAVFLWLLLIWFIDPPARPIRDHYEISAIFKKQFWDLIGSRTILWAPGLTVSQATGLETQRIIYSRTLQELNLAGKIFLLWHRISFWGERTPGALLSLTWTGPRVGVGRGEITLVHVTIQLQHQDWHVSILTPPSKSIQIVYEVH